MDTVQIRIAASEEVQDILVAALTDLPVQGFENEGGHLSVYWLERDWTPVTRAHLDQVLSRFGIESPPEIRLIRHQNWNRIWERSIRPIEVGPFLIRPSWAEVSFRAGNCLELIIDPKMSFGTGHHETTRLMLRHLLDHQNKLDFVLDAGTGTGILAIAAARLGARRVIAYDFDPICLENTTENLELNNVQDQASVRLGSLDVITEKGFTLIMANINRNVLLTDLHGYADRLLREGVLLLAGLQLEDRDTMLAALSDHGMRAIEEKVEGEWWSVASLRDAACC